MTIYKLPKRELHPNEFYFRCIYCGAELIRKIDFFEYPGSNGARDKCPVCWHIFDSDA